MTTYSTICADCRNDRARIRLALDFERDWTEKPIEVGHRKCSMCKAKRPWWWFAKLPLSAAEMDAV